VKSKSLVWALCIALALSLVGVAATGAQDGQAKLVIINFVGGEMIFTLDETLYTVPGIDTVPDGGQLTLALAPGTHKYSGHVPGSEGANGEVELVAGQTQVLGARLERSKSVVSAAGVVLEEPRDVLLFFEASLTPSAQAPEPQPAPLQPLPVGQGALVFVNYIGEALVVDIGGDLYTVPATDRLQVNLPPGEVSYSASAGISGINGTAQVAAGGYTGLGLSREIPPEEPDYEVGEPVPTRVPLAISVFAVSLEDEPVGEAPSASAPASAAASAAPLAADDRPTSAPGGQEELNVVNYVGETLTFTIDNQTYPVAGDGGVLRIDLAPGEYTFTASTPGAGANGSLIVSAGATTRVSVALDVGSGEMRIYVE
jgi:hypothetical protein